MDEDPEIKVIQDELNLIGRAGSKVFAASAIFPHPWVVYSDTVSTTANVFKHDHI